VIYGRINKKGSPSKMLEMMRDNSITIKAAEKLPPEKTAGKILRGVIKKDESIPEYVESYYKLVEVLKAKGGE